MKFTKMHGLGNDYIYINTISEGEYDYSYLSAILSKRHFSIGADGIITIGKPTDSEKADFFMQIYNADGSKGEMCGNGIRCVGKYVYENGLTNKKSLKIETLAGIKNLDLNIKDNKVISVKVDMGVAMLHNGEAFELDKAKHDLQIENRTYGVIDVSMGNPHTVLFADEITDDLVLRVGPLIEKHEYYPNRTNVEFVKILKPGVLQMRVFERGSGETMACGTGACASAVAYFIKSGLNEVTIKLLGGELKISKDKDNQHIILDGLATKVYDGEIDLNDIIKK